MIAIFTITVFQSIKPPFTLNFSDVYSQYPEHELLGEITDFFVRLEVSSPYMR